MSDRRIAVVAIHGVGDHQPSEMAKSVGDILEDLENGPLHPRYCTFGESAIRLNVAPVKVPGHATSPGVAKPRSWGPMDALYQQRREVRNSVENRPDSLDHLFMKGQLEHYKGDGPEQTYECLRLEGKRHEMGTAPHAVAEKELHVYDMFWSDLSGVGKGASRIFGELYQLLFHLGSVGVNNVKAAATFFQAKGTDPPLAQQADAAWRRFSSAQVGAASMLSWPLPILNLIILAFALGLFAAALLRKLSVTEEIITTFLILFAGIAGAWGYSRMRSGNIGHFSSRLPVLAFLFSSAILAGAVAWFTTDLPDAWPGREWIEGIGTALALGAAFFAVWAILGSYNKLRPGTRTAFAYTIAAAVAGALASAPRFTPWPSHFVAMVMMLRLIEVAFWLLLIAWILFWCALAWAFVAGYLARKATARANPDEVDRAKRTIWTARLTLALPATIFLLLTVAAWAGLLTATLPLLPHDPYLPTSACTYFNPVCSQPDDYLCYAPMWPTRGVLQQVSCWAYGSLLYAGLSYMPVLLLFTCVAAVISLWAIVPSVLGEVSSPAAGVPGLEKHSSALGNWLTDGYRFMRWAGRALYLGIASFPLTVAAVVLFALLPESNAFRHWTVQYTDQAKPFAEVLGTIVAGAAVGILGFGGRLTKLALGFRPIVRVALDVDNWLREHPLETNPTARICGRYVSLLRYIAQWQGPDHRPYDALIIFAHSQGTVITADLIRFLHVEAAAAGSYEAYDSTLAWFDHHPVYLFTMGCPLRQMYGLRFPYLYGYAPTGPNQEFLPKPEDLHVEQWVNAYRTGDYVGRDLWRPDPWQPVGKISPGDWDPPNGKPENVWTQGRRVEFAIGPGAHTHYWDSTAKPIAETLDALVARA
jgi:hypothetical protein